MKSLQKLCTGALIVAAFAAHGAAATVDFEAVALGTQYGTPAGHAPGDLVFSQDGVDMTVENFTSGAFVGFHVAEIGAHPGPPQTFFPPTVNSSQALTTNNIDGRFDFTNLSHAVRRVRFQYADAGGTNNFDVNGLGRQEVGDLTTLASYPNYAVSVSATPMAGGVFGHIDVVAAPGHQIKTLTLGGQEVSWDNMRAVPEPTGLAIAGCMLTGLAGAARRRRVA